MKNPDSINNSSRISIPNLLNPQNPANHQRPSSQQESLSTDKSLANSYRPANSQYPTDIAPRNNQDLPLSEQTIPTLLSSRNLNSFPPQDFVNGHDR